MSPSFYISPKKISLQFAYCKFTNPISMFVTYYTHTYSQNSQKICTHTPLLFTLRVSMSDWDWPGLCASLEDGKNLMHRFRVQTIQILGEQFCFSCFYFYFYFQSDLFFFKESKCSILVFYSLYILKVFSNETVL